MRFKVFIVSLFFIGSLFTGISLAQNKVVVIPLLSGEATSSTPPAPVPKTGQIESYGFRDDGYLEKGVASPSPRFTDNDNGTVTDNLTGLVWMRDANCQIFYYGDTSGQNNRNWEDALASCNSLFSGYCSLTDGSAIMTWRLPNRNELESLIDISQWSPALPSGHPSCPWEPGPSL